MRSDDSRVSPPPLRRTPANLTGRPKPGVGFRFPEWVMRTMKQSTSVFYRFQNGNMRLLSSSGQWYWVHPDGQCTCPAAIYNKRCWHTRFRSALLTKIGSTLARSGKTPEQITNELATDFPEILV